MPPMKNKSTKTFQATLDVRSPFDQTLIRTIPLQSAADADSMVQTALRLHRDRDGWLEHFQRIAILKKLAGLVEAEGGDFARLIALEGGKPLMDARVEVARAVDGILLAAQEISRVMRGEEIPMGLTAASKGRIAFTTSCPAVTLPNTVWCPSRCGCGAWVMKNWLPLVPGPALAMEMTPVSCRREFPFVSSSNR